MRWASIVVWIVAIAGCHDLRRDNTATQFTPEPRRQPPSVADAFLKANYLYPGRDWLTLTWLGRALLGDEAWDITADDDVPESALYSHRDLGAAMSKLAANFGSDHGEPRGPWRIVNEKTGGTPGFVGADADGRKFVIKLDEPQYPELGSAAEAIEARVIWALGYNVPRVYVTTIAGTGNPTFDGRRAAAIEWLDGDIAGPFSTDRFRMRREMRALRVAFAWLNDTDRTERNTLAVNRDGEARFYLLDFNSALGSWNGRPKEPWRGHRGAWDVEWQLAGLLTLGLARPNIDANEPVVSPAVGRFSARFNPRTWRPQYPVTAFDRMTRRDAAWMLRKIDGLSEELLRAIVAAGRYSRREDGEYVLRTLLERRERLHILIGDGKR